ncbi:MAG: class I SAM-dependent methyltransferase [Planctomycetota bacterium]|nr:class I SAM-dependent methyltransferase [Planctomycetota bacterium]
MKPTLQETREIWERISVWWDQAIGEGNDFQRALIIPATDQLLEPGPDQLILDVACGNGNYSRHLAKLGARVLACDYCHGILERAREKVLADADRIEYRVIDATDDAQLLALGESRFDSAVCSMAMMDMPTVEPLLHALPKLLKPGGRFVFSISHPCFNSSNARLTAELNQGDGKSRQVFGVAVDKYLSAQTNLSAGILNQPEPHYLFHRPLSAIFAACFQAGFVINGLLEPAYPAGTSAKNLFSWARRPEIPPAIVVRLRLA